MRDRVQHLMIDIERRKKELMDHYSQGHSLQSSLMIQQSQELDELIVTYLQLKKKDTK